VKVVSKKEINKAAMSGVKVRKITVTPKPTPPDHSDRLAGIEAQLAHNISQVREVASSTSTEQDQIKKLIVHVDGQLRSLKHDVEVRRIPPKMEIRRGTQGFISTVTCGGLVFDFKRDRIGTVLEVDISTN